MVSAEDRFSVEQRPGLQVPNIHVLASPAWHVCADSVQSHRGVSALNGWGLFLAECSEDNPCEGLSRHATFTNFGMAFLTLFRVSTGDNWNGIMKVSVRLLLPTPFLVDRGGRQSRDPTATPTPTPRILSVNVPVRTSTASATCPRSPPSTLSPSC